MTNDVNQLQINMEFDKQRKNNLLNRSLLLPQKIAKPEKEKKIPKLPKLNPDGTRIIKRRNRKKKDITRCPHTDMKHYAKGMCNHCYHLFGRNSLADQCEHTDKLNYAKGMCQNCYFNSYNQQKRFHGTRNPDEDNFVNKRDAKLHEKES